MYTAAHHDEAHYPWHHAVVCCQYIPPRLWARATGLTRLTWHGIMPDRLRPAWPAAHHHPNPRQGSKCQVQACERRKLHITSLPGRVQASSPAAGLSWASIARKRDTGHNAVAYHMAHNSTQLQTTRGACIARCTTIPWFWQADFTLFQSD